MPALNLVLIGDQIQTFLRRISFDPSQLQEGDDAFWSLAIMDFWNNYIYCLDQTDLNTVKTWLDGKSYTYGSDEDLTHASEINDWLSTEQTKGGVGSESKSDIYTRLKVDFPAQECIDANS